MRDFFLLLCFAFGFSASAATVIFYDNFFPVRTLVQSAELFSTP